jgi:hypothetical protein
MLRSGPDVDRIAADVSATVIGFQETPETGCHMENEMTRREENASTETVAPS